MNKPQVISTRWISGIAAALLLAPAIAAQAASATSPEAVYQKERAACLEGRTQQARPTCLKEAGAALNEARHNRLPSEDPQVLANNALKRCDSVKPEEREDCQRMARGEGVVSGTPESGGVMKELVTRSVEPTPPVTTIPEPPPATR